jgi:hypothetical protein
VIALAKKFVRTVMPGVAKPLHILWNEMIGFFFIALAVIATPSAYRQIKQFDGEPKSIFRVLLSCTFALIMIVFGVHSFGKARKIKRS